MNSEPERTKQLEKIAAWVDGELDDTEALEIAQLILHNPELAAEADRQRLIANVGTKMPDPDPVSDADWQHCFDGIMTGLALEPKAQPKVDSGRGGGMVVFSLMVSMAAVLLLSFQLGLLSWITDPTTDADPDKMTVQNYDSVKEVDYAAQVEYIEWNDDLFDMILVERVSEDVVVVSVN